jgi:GNAT superfamily N-acetyltransferase
MARATRLLKTEGLRGLMLGIVRFWSALVQRTFWWERFLVHEFVLTDLGDVSQAPPVAGLEVHVIECEDDADRLAREGYEDFRLPIGASRRRLESGAVAFCAHVDRVLAHVAWVALDADAKRSFDTLPYSVDFANGEGCSGGSWTFPRYRGWGIYRYVMGCRLAYLQSRGCTVCRNATLADNVAGLRGQEVFPHRVVSRARVRILFGRMRWTEYPSDEGGT